MSGVEWSELGEAVIGQTPDVGLVTVIEQWVVDASLGGGKYRIKQFAGSAETLEAVPAFTHCPAFTAGQSVWVQFNNGHAVVIHGRSS